MKTLEVRCCCQPRKLLGWVDVPDHMAQDGMTLVGTLRQYPHVTFAKFHEAPVTPTIKQVIFPIELYATSKESHLAVKAEGYTGTLLETLLMPWNFRPALTRSDSGV